MAERRNTFDFRDQDFNGERERLAATRAPSVAAGDLASQTRSAIQAVRQPPTQFPTNTATPNRTGPSIRFINTPEGRDPTSPVSQAKSQADDLFKRAQGAKSLVERSGLLRQALAQSDFATAELRGANAQGIADTRARSAADIAELGARTDVGLAGLRDRRERDIGTLGALTDLSTTDTRTRAQQAIADERNQVLQQEGQLDRILRARQGESDNRTRLSIAQADTTSGNSPLMSLLDGITRGQVIPPPIDEGTGQAVNSAETVALRGLLIDSILDPRTSPTAQQQGLDLAESLGIDLSDIVADENKLADGGMVMPQPGGGSLPALGSASPNLPDPEALNAYQRYAKGAEAMGLTVVGFDQFSSMRQQAQPVGAIAAKSSGAGAPVAMANGGQVPGADASGKMVVDPDPNAPTDSIPAVIDGTTPAALDSGEIVFPRSAVMYYGTDKLMKMIAKAAEAENGTNGSGAGSTA